MTKRMIRVERVVIALFWRVNRPSGTFPPLDVHGTSVHPSHIPIHFENFGSIEDSYWMSIIDIQ